MRKENARIDASVLLLVLIAVLLAAGVLFVFFSLRQDPVNESFTGDTVINTLFVIENGEKNPGKPLSSYVLMYYPATQRAAVFDVPGSLGQIIQRVNRVDRIDTVYDPRRITPFTEELEKLLGIEISYSIAITLENLGRITDLVEGVELFIPSPVNEYQDEYIMFPSGVSWLDGDKAKVYITYELPEENTELATFRRQRFFMGLIKRLGTQNLFLKNPSAEKAFRSLLGTGMNRRTHTRLFDEFAKIDTDRISIQSVGGDIREVSGQSLIFPHWDGNLIKDIVRQTLGDLVRPAESTLNERILTVEILNGTTVTGLAGRTAELLRGFGYDIVDIGNADTSNYEKTVIIDRTDSGDAAKTFAGILRCDNIRQNPPELPGTEFSATELSEPEFADMEIGTESQNFEYRADITLILGKDFNGRYVTE